MRSRFGGIRAKQKAKIRLYSHIAVKGLRPQSGGDAALDGGRIVVRNAGTMVLKYSNLGSRDVFSIPLFMLMTVLLNESVEVINLFRVYGIRPCAAGISIAFMRCLF